MGPVLRKFTIGIALVCFIGAWAGVVIAKLTTDSLAIFTLAVTAAALATEALIWVAAILGGWSIFANRRAIWDRMRGRKSDPAKVEGV
ncbi:hypothetical protein [Maricaulis salignorans]|uniref:Uncharacterized protein n=1 Tax=Maricaulis salignorans TaxID=144026 RepID=A0A1G9WNW0_9PROT|nr:hypothetical protein [Maricaulis salignorans]SDM86077.1 hypothetical protein SAMN04488568_12622 [Maricaulis salignorans]